MNILKGFAIGLLAVFLFPLVLLGLLLGILVLIILGFGWACGAPIRLKYKDVDIGYVRWFKFYPK